MLTSDQQRAINEVLATELDDATRVGQWLSAQAEQVLALCLEDADDLVVRPTAEAMPPARAGEHRVGKTLLPYFDHLLTMIGLENLQSFAAKDGEWEVWTAMEQSVLTRRVRPLAIALLHKPATDTRVRDVGGALVRLGRSTQVTFVLGPELPDSPEIHRAVLDILPSAEIVHYASLVQSILGRLVSRASMAVEGDAVYFVDPAIAGPDGVQVSAIEVLDGFLRHGKTAAVAVVLGPGGAGKSTVVERLRRYKAPAVHRNRPELQPLRLVVSQEHWVSLERRRAEVTTESILREALAAHGFGRDDLEQVDVLLCSGALTLVFDSFDEVCSRGPRTSANDILERILRLTETVNSRARVIITSRPEFWELVDPALRDRCTTFTLQPFGQAHVNAYLNARFKDAPAAHARAQQALRPLPHDLLRIPLVLVSVVEAVASGGDVTQFMEQTQSGIRRSDPLPGVARVVMEREREKHALALPVSSQVRLFTTLSAEYGFTWSLGELADVGQIDFGLTEADIQKFTRHLLVRPVSAEGEQRFTFRYPEIIRVLIGERVVQLFEQIASGAVLGPREASELRQLLIRTETEFAGVTERVGSALRSQARDAAWWERLWTYRAKLATSPEAQSALFRMLLESQVATPDGYRQPLFLPRENGFLMVTDYAHRGSISRVDLSGVHFVGVQFSDTEIASCRFSSVTAFAKCSFVRSTVGRDCEDLKRDIFLGAEIDDETVARSKRWVQFPTVTPDALAKIALQRVIHRALQSVGVLGDSAESAFSLGANWVEDALEEHAADILRNHRVVDEQGGRFRVQPKYHEMARKLVRHGEFVGVMQTAFRDMVTWTAQSWRDGRSH